MISPFKSKHWDFWKDGVSPSLINLWLTCREQFRLEVCEGWRSRKEPLYFAFGTCVHWILERAYKRPKPPNQAALKRLVNKYEVEWLAECPQPTQWQTEQQEKVYGLVEALLPSYFKFWKGDWKGYRYAHEMTGPIPRERIAIEDHFSQPYTFPDGKVLKVGGTRDLVFRDKRHKQVWVSDTKCMSIIKEEEIIDTLQYLIQPMLYCWALWKSTGQMPAGFIINLLRRPGHRIGKQERLDVFFGRVAEDITKKPEHSFQRFVMDLVKSDLVSWERTQLVPILHDMRNWYEGNAPHYANTGNITTKYGRCRTFNIITKADYTGYYQVANVMDYQKRLT